MAKLRKQTYTMDMYLEKIKDWDIRNDADVQRQFVWNNEQVNELVVTVLTDDYIPPIILGEEDNSQLWIVDGGQRSGAFMKYRYGNYKITTAVANALIPYKAKVKDENRNAVTDGEGNIIWEDAVFNIRNKTYSQLPDELKKKFNEYQIETVIHEHCDTHRISQLIKRYNNHTSMNTSQKAFTYIDNFAREIRNIAGSRFFVDYSVFDEKEKNKGVLERVIVESVMCTNHVEHWKKQTKEICAFLNKNADKKEFEKLGDNIHRLENIITDDMKSIFNSKDTFIFLALFDRFVKLGMEDSRFAEFLQAFQGSLRQNAADGNGVKFDEIDKEKGTKDKAVIVSKLNMLEMLMRKFFQMEDNAPDREPEDVETFISETVSVDKEAIHMDLEFYGDVLEDLQDRTIRTGSKLREEGNRLSLLAMVVYSFQKDIDPEDWLEEYAKNHDTYFTDQRENYLYMRDDFDKYCEKEARLCIQRKLGG